MTNISAKMTATVGIPVLPYTGTSGWSGSDTSRERAINEDRQGITSARQRQILAMVAQSRVSGMTWREIAEQTGWHHGQVSGALSNLHRAGYLMRLTERRDRCAVYVRPEWRQDRDFALPQSRARKCCPHCGGAL